MLGVSARVVREHVVGHLEFYLITYILTSYRIIIKEGRINKVEVILLESLYCALPLLCYKQKTLMWNFTIISLVELFFDAKEIIFWLSNYVWLPCTCSTFSIFLILPLKESNQNFSGLSGRARKSTLSAFTMPDVRIVVVVFG